MRTALLITFVLAMAAAPPSARAEDPVRTTYKVKQVSGSTVYIDGGSALGLAEGMRLHVSHLDAGDAKSNTKDLGTLTVFAVASNSSACEFATDTKSVVQVGDEAELYEADAEAIRIAATSKSHRKYPQVVSFSEGDPIEAELREYIPRPPSPEVNRIKGRVSFEQNAILDHSSGISTRQEGVVLRADMTRLGGTYWNFTGYWRGRVTSSSGAVTTLDDLLNRTYQIGMYYNNPESKWTAGFGRFLLPWAPSLSTIDGGYIGRRVAKEVTVGMFAGSTPDPTAWNYDPNREMLGVFASFEHGDFERVRYTSTVGAAISRVHWRPERNFIFFENNVSINRIFSLYHDLEADELGKIVATPGNTGPRLARSFLSLRIQPHKRVSFDISHNYFRGVPTFDPRLIGLGLLDKMLFQGFSVGARVDLAYNTSVYGNIGLNKRQDDPKQGGNYMGGVTFNRIRWVPFRTDLRYTQFSSSYASGNYRSITLSRNLGEAFRLEVQGGEQNLSSMYTAQSRSRFINSSLDYLIGLHYILGGGWTLYRGGVQDYDQIFFNLGYRF